MNETLMTVSGGKLPAASAETTATFLANAGPALAALCTACGACFNACPMAEHVGLRDADPASVTDGLRRLARDQAASADTISWVNACAKSGLCVASCPEKSKGLDAMLLVRIAKQRALNETHQIPAKQDPTYFPRLKTYAQLQLSDEELAAWL
jgi:Fe-S oxidoreductase